MAVIVNNDLFLEVYQENLILLYGNNKGADQPTNPGYLISAFVIDFLESIMPLLTTISIFRR